MIHTIIQALADPRRRDILDFIRDKELASSAIASHFSVSPSAISQHLKVLEEAGLVAVRRADTQRIYAIRMEGFYELKQYFEYFWGDSR
ncbi:metalloregulator ArsR/SmtB family transcription factor [Paenibacillus sp. CF384]|uniref:ArsR/SmtB family transcription factor n=1 Tax=Paenibacillus sp. CF384 TaxID=1884382 RepID=UPI001C43400F